MKIKFCGSRGSIAAPGPETVIYGGNTTCVEVVSESGQTSIIDCGTGIRNLGDQIIKDDRSSKVNLFMTHIHWDHLLGLPFFGPLFRPECHITVNGCRQCFAGLKRIFCSDYIDGAWPVRYEDLKAKIDPPAEAPVTSFQMGDVSVFSHPLQHPQGGLGFKFQENGKTFVFLTDNELLEDGWVGSAFRDFVKFCRGADVLVHDAQYLPEEIQTRRGWGHSDYESVCRLAIQAEVKKLFLFHHDPWRTDKGVSKIIDRAWEYLDVQGYQIEIDAAREGATIYL